MISLHPSFRPLYYFFYFEGLARLFPGRKICVDRDGFPEKTLYDDGCALYVRGAPRSRIYLAANDHARIDPVGLAWCDVYGIVNCPLDLAASEPTLGDQISRVAPTGPSFGVKLESMRESIAIASAALVANVGHLARGKALARELAQLGRTRLSESRYVPRAPETGYVFHLSWPWRKHSEVNPPRERFIRACQSVRSIHFEGGFAPRRRRDVDGLDGVSARRRYPLAEYVEKTARSEFVFNCPAVHGCHGWKLGEYLALGKAIISLPLSREMPAPLTHGQHVHYVADDPEAIRDAIELLHGNRKYRDELGRAARRYYEQYLAPEAVVARLLGLENGR